MKKFLLTVLTLTGVMAAQAGGIDLQSRIMLQRQKLEKSLRAQNAVEPELKAQTAKAYTPTMNINDSGTVMGFVRIADGFDRGDLESAGLNVLAVKGNVAIVSMVADSAATIALHPSIKKLSLERSVRPLMEKSRAASGVDVIHQGGDGLTRAYTGKGVLAAIIDQGVDPNHVAFLDANGKSRVTYLTNYNGYADSAGNPYYDLYGDEIYGEDSFGNTFWYPTMDKFDTDTYDSYHGTHTMNIMAGGFHGQIEEAIGQNASSGTGVMQKKANPYYGVAPDAQMAVSCGVLSDACIAFGLNGILDYAAYAREVADMPSVVNMSLGSSAGPHDPNSFFNYFLELCGEESIIVLAAGNEGDLKIALRKNLTAQDNTVSTMIYPYGFQYNPKAPAGQNNTYIRNGYVMVYSDSDKPFKLRAFVMTGSEGNYRKRATFDISSEEGSYYLSNSYYANYVGGSVNTTVQRYFDGYIGGGTMLDEELGRYYGVVDYYLYTNPETGFNEDGSEGVIVGFEVEGEDGQRIECYGDGMNTWMSNYGMDQYDDGSRDGTISDMAVGRNVLTVGAYTMNTSWRNLDGSRNWYDESQGFVLNDIGQYSSYATMPDGSTLPHVCAPGSVIMSAMSTPYVESYFKGYEQYIPMNFQARATVDGRTYYWKQETGTSMSTPFVAGSIALWLEADPSLDIDKVKEIVAKTSDVDEYVKNGIPAQWGAGKFNALAGLKEVIRQAGVGGVTVDSHNNRLMITPQGAGVYNIFVGDAGSLDVKVYSLSGGLVHASQFEGCEADVDLGNLTKGVYVVRVNDHSQKVVLN